MENVYKKLVIILPAYNESQNLRTLLQAIFKLSKNIHVIIVDDSIESEKKKIAKIVHAFKNIHIIYRDKKSGRGSAILEGLKQAIKTKSFAYFIEMDTDLAHDPGEIPLFLQTFQKSHADLIIGARYLDKSKILKWPKRRLYMSKLINRFLNFWLGLQIHDYTNGFRMYSREAVGYLIKKGLHEKNFIALSESAYLLRRKKFTIVEIPITFTDRKHGVSSVGTGELWQCLLGAVRIRFR